MSPVDLLLRLQALDVEVRVQQDALRLSVPLDSLPRDLRDALAEQEPELVRLLADMSRTTTPAAPSIERRDRDAALPLSFAQERFWLLSQFDRDSSPYNLVFAVRLGGSLDVEALRASLGEVVARHEVLRTEVRTVGDQARQVIAEPKPLELVVEEVEPGGDVDAEVSRLVRAQERKTFDLSVGPLYRVALHQLAADDHLLVVVLHHMLGDRWSFGVLFDELSQLYEARRTGDPLELPDLPIQYADYAIWERAHYAERREELVAYWADRLRAVPALALPTDRPRPAEQTFGGARCSFTISSELTDRLEAVGGADSCTFFMAMLAAFNVLLARHSGQEDIAVGTPVGGREKAEIEPLIGLFVNTLVLRSDVSGNPTFRELLGRTRETVLAGFERQEMPFERLVAELRPERDPSRNPFFQAMFNLLGDAPAPSLGDVQVSLPPEDVSTALLDLTLWVVRTERGCYGRFEYNVDLFDEVTVERMVARFITLLEAIVEDPDRCIAELPLLTAAEQREVIVDVNATEHDYPRERCYHELFEERAQQSPDAVAAVAGGETLTYSELNVRANRLAHHLRGLGAAPDKLVGISAERSLDMLVGLLGIMKSGAAYVPLDPAYPNDRLAFIIEDAGLDLLVTQESLRPRLPDDLPELVRLDVDAEVIAGHPSENLGSGAGPDNLAYVIFTSGSTGKPKGVQIEHRALVNFLAGMAERPGFSADDVLVAVTTISFDIAGLELYLPLLVGGRVVIASSGEESDGARLGQLIATSGATVMQATPATWQLLLDSGWSGDPGLRVLCGGEALPRELAERLVARCGELWNMYGPTETTIWSLVGRVESGDGLVSIGEPIANTQVYLLDRHRQPVPLGVVGELYLGGDGLARGYWRRPELTAEKFVAHPLEQGQRVYNTGDLARYRSDGAIEFLGRVDHQVKIRGFRIELGEIEHVLAGHDAVAECAVVTQSSAAGDAQLSAHVVLRSGASVSPTELRSFLGAALPDYMVPPAFAFPATLPLTPAGKVDRLALSDSRAAVAGGVEFVAPRTASEKLVARIWRDVLGVERAGVHDNFFALGGHSLLAMKVVFAVERELGHRLSPMELLTGDLGAFAVACDGGDAASAAKIELVARDQPLWPSSAQRRFWLLWQIEPDGAEYNVPLVLRLRGKLDVAALRWSVGEIDRRHEVLRTTFATHDGEPVLVIAEPGESGLAEVDVSAHPEPESEVSRLVLAEVRRPFDLANGPVCRTVLYRLADDHHVLAMTVHHVTMDEWSQGLWSRELAALYAARVSGVAARLPELAVQYADYAQAQRQSLNEDRDGLGYWTEQLDGVTQIDLPIDRPRPSAQTFVGAAREFSLPRSVSDGLKALGHDEGCTFFMTMLAGLQALLARYTGQDDIAVGTPVANRRGAETEPLIGLFLNTLVLRTDLSGDPSFRELLRRVRETALGAFRHRNVPFEELVSELGTDRDLARTPLFSVFFQVQEPWSDLSMGDVVAELYPLAGATAQFDLTFALIDGVDGVDAVLEYNCDLFDDATIGRMVDHLGRLLEQVVIDPDLALGDVAALGDAERQRLLVEWNGGEDPELETECVHELFEAQVSRSPDQTAVLAADARFSYAGLNARANRLAHHLRGLGVGPEVVVGVCLERSSDAVVAILGILKAGGAFCPMDPDYPTERLGYMVSDCGMPIVITHPNRIEPLSGSGARLLCFEAIEEELGQQSVDNPVRTGGPESLAYVMFTSGSTGEPKGVMVPHHAICHHTRWMLAQWPMDASERALQLTALTFDPAICEMWVPLASGAVMVIAPPDASRDVEMLVETVRSNRITTMNSVPTMLKALLAGPGLKDCPSLRRVYCGGEAMPSALCEEFLGHSKAVLLNVYGPTEMTIDATWHQCTEPSVWDTMPIGQPIAHASAYVVDASMRLVPQGVAGELCMAGPGLARGYLNRDALTAERFVPDPFRGGGSARMYRTGDRVRWRADGQLEFLGRVDDQVKVRGVRIEPGEVEVALCGHERVAEAVVIARGGAGQAKMLVAYVVASGAGALSVSDLRAYLGAMLPAAMVPSAFVFIDAIPLKSSGKVDRGALPEPESVRPDLASDYVAPGNPAEEALVGLWAELLGVDRVGVCDNFFDLGGDSILILQVVVRARDAGLRLTPKQLFEHQTVRQLAAVAGDAAPTQAMQAPVTGRVPLTPIQRWFFEREIPERHHFNQPFLLTTRERLDPDRLRRVLAGMVEHHDALRIRFTSAPSGWQQDNADVGAVPPLEVVDLSDLSEAEQAAQFVLKATETQRRLDLGDGPLLRAVLFDFGEERSGRLLIVAHHLVVDGVSWRVLLEDLESGYRQLSRGEPLVLPPKTTSFLEWGTRLVSMVESGALSDEVETWRRVAGSPVVPLPVDHVEGDNSVASECTETVTLDAEETDELLRDVPAVYRTQINDVLLTALALSFEDWTGERSLRIDLEGHGREPFFDDVDVSRTVGWFTTVFPVGLELPDSRDPGVALCAIKERLRAIPRAGAGYGMLRYLAADAEVPASASEVAFNYFGRFDQVLSEESLFGPATDSIGPSASERGPRAYLLEINAAVGDGRLQIGWNYSAGVFDRETVQALAARYVESLRSLIIHCRSVEHGRFTPSDFSLAQLEQEQLDHLAAEFQDLEDVYPMSQVQQGMLFHDLSEPGVGVYVSQSRALLRGLDPVAFRRSWECVVDRHPILRTGFCRDGLDEPLQVVRRRVELPWREEDCREMDAIAARDRVAAISSEDRRRPFEYSRAPLMRLSLVRCEDDAFHFTWTQHLLLLDGWSASALVREVFAVYWSLVEGDPIELPVPRRYRDYIAWLQRQDASKSESFWRETLEGIEGPTALGIAAATDLAPDSDRERFEDRLVQLSPETTARVQELSRRDRLTISSIVHGVWALLLSRYSGERDVVFGSTVSGRPSDLPGVEDMLGVFINTLPVRVSVPAADRAGQWLQQLQGHLADMRQFEHTPLVDVQRWSQVPRSSPLFESIVVFENYPVDETVVEHSRSLTVENADLHETTNYPLTLIAAGGRQLSLRLYFDTHLFDGEAIDRMLAHAGRLIEGLVARPGAALSELPTLTDAEASQLQARGRGKPLGSEDRCLHELFAARAEHTPDAIAVECGDERLTYAELRRAVSRLARQLRRRGAGPGRLVGISLQRSTTMLVALLAILESGAAYVPLDPSYPGDRIAFIIEDAGLELLVTEQAVADTLPEQSPELVLVDELADAELADADEGAGDDLNVAVGPDDLAYVIFTSGSTGKPKGVQIEHRALVNFLRSMADEPGMTDRDVLVAVTTISFDIAGLELYLPLLVGGKVVIAEDGVESDGKQLAALLEHSGATLFQATPATYRLLVESGWKGRGAMKALCGGETLPRDLAEDLLPRCAELWNMYGPTETTIWSLIGRVQTGVGPVSIGEPIANTDLVLLDPQGQLAAVGVPASLYLGGSGLGRGYWNRPELTSEKFGTYRLAGAKGQRLYDTGDLARWRADGSLEFLGRMDHQVKVRGFRIELGEIEACLSEHETVQACGVVVSETKSGDKRLAGHVVLQPGCSVTVTQLRQHLSASLPDYMIPSTLVMLDELPLTPNGKLDRRALEVIGGGASRADRYHPPATPIEEAVAEIWKQVLEVERVGRYDNFFDLGGHSLLAMRVSFQAEKLLGIDVLPMELLLQNLAQFAEMCAKRGAHTEDESDVPPPETSKKSWFHRLKVRLKGREKS